MPYTLKTIKQKILPRSLYGRSLIIIVVPIFLIQVIVAYIFIDQNWERTSDKLVFALSGEMKMIVSDIRRAKTDDEVKAVIGQAHENLGLDVSVEDKRKSARHPKRAQGLTWYSVESKLQKYLERMLRDPFVIIDLPESRRFEVDIQVDARHSVKFVSDDNRLMDPRAYIFILWLVGSSIVLMAVAILFM